MSNMNVQQRKFIVKAGMTVNDIKNSKEATAMQKKYASAFDTDGQKGFSQKEADLFNATTFSEKSDGTVTFWTRQKDGTKKGTKFNSKDNNIQFKSDDEVKPYVKKVAVKKAAPKQNESISFFDEAWSGHQISRLTGDNAFTDWLQNKDKKCTDGKDDGKIGFWEGTKSFVKGLVGGIPKAMINHPVATTAALAVGGAAIFLSGGAILPVLGAVGVATGAGMVGYGGYKAATAKTDGEAKQALETMGMGVTTTALSVASAEKALEKAAEAGVKSAQVSEDAGILEKTVQMFKSIPECLTKSKEWARFNLNLPTAQEYTPNGKIHKRMYGEDSYREYRHNFVGDNTNENVLFEKMPNGTYKKYSDRTYHNLLIEESTTDGIIKKYDDRYGVCYLKEEIFENGSYKKYDSEGNIIEEMVVNDNSKAYYKNGILKKETLADGTYREYSKSREVITEKLPDGTRIDRYIKYNGIEKEFTKTTNPNGTYKVIIDKTGVLFEEKLADGTIKAYYSKYEGIEGDLTVVTKNGTTNVFDTKTGNIIQGQIVEGNKTSFFEGGKLVLAREDFANGGYKLYDAHGTFTEGKIIEGDKTSLFEKGELVKEIFADGSYKKYAHGTFTEGKIIEGNKTTFFEGGKLVSTKEKLPNGGYKIYDTNGNFTEGKIIEGDKTSFFEKGELVKEKFADGSYKKYDKGIIIEQKSAEEVAREAARAARAYSSSQGSSSSEHLFNGATPSMHIKNLSTGEVTSFYDVEDCPSYATRQLYESLGYHFVHR